MNAGTIVHVQPNGYDAGQGFVSTENFPLARAIMEWSDSTSSFECSGRVGRVTVGGNPNHGHATPPLGTLHVTSAPGENATIEGLEFWSTRGALGDLVFSRVTLEAPTGSNSAVGQQLVDFHGARLEFADCRFTNNADRSREAKWGMRLGSWRMIVVIGCDFPEYYVEHDGYIDCAGSMHIEGNTHFGTGRTNWQYTSRPAHGPVVDPDGTLIFKNDVCRSAPGDGGGMITVAGYTGRGVWISGCEFHIGEGAGNRRAVTIWTPISDGPSQYGQWVLGGGKWHEIHNEKDLDELREEHGEVYGTRHVVIDSCALRMDGGTLGAIELSGVKTAIVKGRMEVYGDGYHKEVLNMNKGGDWPNGLVTLGWKKPSKWRGFQHAGVIAKDEGHVLSDEEVDALGAGR